MFKEHTMSVGMAKYIRVRCSYCGKVVRSNGKGELIYPRNRRVTDEAKSYMKLYTIVAGSSKVIHVVGFTCPYCGTNILGNIDMKKNKYK